MNTSAHPNRTFLLKYVHKPCVQCILSGQYQLRTLQQYHINDNNTQHIAIHFPIRISNDIALLEVWTGAKLAQVCFGLQIYMFSYSASTWPGCLIWRGVQSGCKLKLRAWRWKGGIAEHFFEDIWIAFQVKNFSKVLARKGWDIRTLPSKVWHFQSWC